MDPSKRGFMNLLNQGSPSQQSSQNSPPTQFPSTFSQSQFPQSPHFTQASPPNFQTFNPFGPPANYHLYGSSPPNFQAASKLVTICTNKLSRFSSPRKLDALTKSSCRVRLISWIRISLSDQPKWQRILEEDSKNKRTKISESGAYTSSSNQETEEETSRKEKRPEGQKKAKAKLKGKGKKPAPSPLGDQPSQDFVLFNEAVKLRAEAVLKSAEATTKSAEAKKEQTRMEKYQTYLKLLDKDTANFSDAKLKRHEAVLEKLATELAEE
uniref:No apical meristem-associated C-terminal domain-containing protein n=1 Tax=Oryza rufipogon TaxID=4529 RepID=A0A0E0QFU5_ORYRU